MAILKDDVKLQVKQSKQRSLLVKLMTSVIGLALSELDLRSHLSS